MYILKAMTTRPPNWSNTYFPTYLPTYPSTYLPPLGKHPLRAILETCDFSDIWSKWWSDMTYLHTMYISKAYFFQCVFFQNGIFAKCILSFASFFSLRWAIYLWHKSCANYLCDDQSLEEIPRSEKIQSLLVQQTTFCIISFGPVQTQTRNVQKPNQIKENYFLGDTLTALSD